MKRILNNSILFVAIISLIVSCKDNYENTIANLKVAITNEANSKEKYLAFAEKASNEGYKNIANMFKAAAAAENVHLNSFNEVLKKLGEPEFTPTPEAPTVNSTADNIQNSTDSETKEYTETYPNFIATAKKENSNDAVEVFKLASLAEENHSVHFSAALTMNDNAVPQVFFVCTRCGGLFLKNFTKCGLCQADTERQYYIPLVFDAR